MLNITFIRQCRLSLVLLALSLIGLIVTFSHPSGAQGVPPGARSERGETPRRLTVMGHGEIRVKPNQGTITIGVVTEATSSQEAAKASASRSQAVLEAVRNAGVAERDVQTVNYSIFPLIAGDNRPGGANQAPQITGYRVYNQVRVTVHDLNKMGAILDAATAAGSNTVEGISFGLQDQEESAYQDQALEQAVADARRKANHIARAAGRSILGIYEINEGSTIRPLPFMVQARAASEAATPIAPGEMTVASNVTIVYQMSTTANVASSSLSRAVSRR